jgi:SHOCT-like protein
MSDETRRVLELLAQGKVTVDEADQLLRAIKDQGHRAEASSPANDAIAGKTRPRFLRVHVHKPGKPGREDKDVNIRVPMAVIRGGMRLGTMIPGLHSSMNARLRERGIDVDLGKIDPAALESMLSEMGEINIDVAQTGEQVRITCE